MDDLVSKTQNRKQDHIRINLNEDVESLTSTGFEYLFFINNSLPNLNLIDIKTDSFFLGKKYSAPLLISSMTGGTKEGQRINQNLAYAAESRGIGIGLGSQRAGLENEEVARSFNLRKIAPHIPIFANLGAIQLNNGVGVDDCKKIIDISEADALILHLNALQEALQPEGQTNFAGLLPKISAVCRQVEVPVIVKEVGWGFSKEVAGLLIDSGVACIDVAGAGGTSWSQVEKFRNSDESRIRISTHFSDWGIPTADSVKEICEAFPGFPVIASGGIRKGLDIAKSIALGASLGGIAGAFLKAASHSSEAAVNLIDEIILELKITMFAVGAANILDLHKTPLLRRENH